MLHHYQSSHFTFSVCWQLLSSKTNRLIDSQKTLLHVAPIQDLIKAPSLCFNQEEKLKCIIKHDGTGSSTQVCLLLPQVFLVFNSNQTLDLSLSCQRWECPVCASCCSLQIGSAFFWFGCSSASWKQRTNKNQLLTCSMIFKHTNTWNNGSIHFSMSTVYLVFLDLSTLSCQLLQMFPVLLVSFSAVWKLQVFTYEVFSRPWGLSKHTLSGQVPLVPPEL